MNAADARVPLVFEDTASARDVFLAWEKLRLVFNAALVLATVLALWLGPPHGRVDGRLLVLLGTRAVLVNIAFCVGPVLESAFAWAGTPRTAVRLVLFTPGCLFAIGAAFSEIGVYLVRRL